MIEFFCFFLKTELYILTSAVIAQNFSPNAEVVILIGLLINKSDAEIETQQLTAEIKIRKSSKQVKVLHSFTCFLLINSLSCISSKR